MASEVVRNVADVPWPVAIFLDSAYVVLLTIGVVASFCTFYYLLWRHFRRVGPFLPSIFAPKATTDKGTQMDQELMDLELLGGRWQFWNDTDEEYLGLTVVCDSSAPLHERQIERRGIDSFVELSRDC